jgi:hypothetical protein
VTEQTKSQNIVPIHSEAENIARAAQEDAGFLPNLKFNAGAYFLDKEEIALGSKFLAHAIGWTRVWLKFGQGKLLERNAYPVLEGRSPPLRDDLGDLDQSRWEISEMTRQPQDPWVLQQQLPMESEHGMMCTFISSSFGGKRAVSDLCSAWARRASRDPRAGQPIIKLSKTMMPTRFGPKPRPLFEIVGWDEVREAVRAVEQTRVKTDDMNDEIPF